MLRFAVELIVKTLLRSAVELIVKTLPRSAVEPPGYRPGEWEGSGLLHWQPAGSNRQFVS